MKKYLFKTLIFLLACFAVITLVLLKYGGYVDYFYVKFTTPKAKSMIIGDSRSMQGIQPSVVNEALSSKDYSLPVFNYSFTIAQASMGPLYNESILKKLDTSSSNGLFIISVTPWMFGSDKNNDNAKGEFREENSPPHNMHYVDVNPNYEYLLKNLQYFHFRTIFRQSAEMHKDGWLEEKNLPQSEAIFKAWKEGQSKIFDNMMEEYVVSDIRLESFHKLVVRLQEHGEVILVRMPIDSDFIEKEHLFYPSFDSDMERAAQKFNIPYFNFDKQFFATKFKTYDGHHLDKIGGQNFTKTLCDSIISIKNSINIPATR
ncbi:hypothetical protein [Muricauda brasiliensis]|uniref:hypothetical protein n=1 Tax=Muricauda brasiliensis TaxID=2162892 RepID=UPI000D3BFA52|nr:hypothetical protein [Muricauda brasiliensis]